MTSLKFPFRSWKHINTGGKSHRFPACSVLDQAAEVHLFHLRFGVLWGWSVITARSPPAHQPRTAGFRRGPECSAWVWPHRAPLVRSLRRWRHISEALTRWRRRESLCLHGDLNASDARQQNTGDFIRGYRAREMDDCTKWAFSRRLIKYNSNNKHYSFSI